MGTTNELQQKVNKVFRENFGYTPLKERLDDIQNEFIELIKWSDVQNLKEEAGDLLASLIQLHTENGWSISETVQATLDKINKRNAQYKSLGRKTKVAIYGGAFDPITKGHIQAAKLLLDFSGEFDEVWIMPAYKHMYGKNMAEAAHRLMMCELAAKVDARIKVFEYEIDEQLAGETYNLVKRLKEEEIYKDNYHFSMVIGLDNANSFDKWVNYELLERLIRFVVVPRKGYKPMEGKPWYFNEPHIFMNDEINIMEVSSSEIRELLKNYWYHQDHNTFELEERIKNKVDEKIFEYIKEHQLYQV